MLIVVLLLLVAALIVVPYVFRRPFRRGIVAPRWRRRMWMRRRLR